MSIQEEIRDGYFQILRWRGYSEYFINFFHSYSWEIEDTITEAILPIFQLEPATDEERILLSPHRRTGIRITRKFYFLNGVTFSYWVLAEDSEIIEFFNEVSTPQLALIARDLKPILKGRAMMYLFPDKMILAVEDV